MRKSMAVLLLLLPFAARAQNPARYDMPTLTTTPGQVPVGSLPPVLAVPNATIAVCGYPAVMSGGMCTNTITTYTDATLTTACPASSQLTAPGSAACISTTGLQGSFGFWYDADAQTHMTYTIRTSWGTSGPFDILPPAGGGGGAHLPSSGVVCASSTTQGVACLSSDIVAALNTTPSTLLNTLLLPVATNTAAGIVQCDGTTTNCNNGIISVTATAGVSSLNSLTGPVSLQQGSNITIAPGGGNTLVISSTGSGSGCGTGSNCVITNPAAAQQVTQPVVSTLQTTLAVNSINNTFIASQFQTGGGNNGIANSVAFNTGTGITVQADPGYAANETISNTGGNAYAPDTSALPNWPTLTHVQDLRGGQQHDIFSLSGTAQFNVTPEMGEYYNNSYQVTGPTLSFQNTIQQATYNGVGQQINGFGGVNLKSYWTNATWNYYSTAAGQHLNRTANMLVTGVGDVVGNSAIITCDGGASTYNDVGCHAKEISIAEDHAVFQGTITSATSSTLQVNPTSGAKTQGDQRFIIDTTTGVITGSGYPTAYSTGNFNFPPSPTPWGINGQVPPDAAFVGTSFPASTLVMLCTTQFGGTCPNNSSANPTGQIKSASGGYAPGTLTVQVVTAAPGLPNAYQTTTTGLSAGDPVCIADTGFFEMTTIASVVDSTHLSINFTKPHFNGATLAFGGMCGYGIAIDGSTFQYQGDPTLHQQVFPVLGSLDSTDLLVWDHSPQQNWSKALIGSNSSAVCQSDPVAITSVSGTTVTFVDTKANFPVNPYFLNNTVTLATSNSTYNGAFGVTGTSIYYNGESNYPAYQYTASVSGSQPATGTATVCNTSFHLYPMGEVEDVLNPSTHAVDGYFQTSVRPVSSSFQVGDTVSEPHYFWMYVNDSVAPDGIFQTQPQPFYNGVATAGFNYGDTVSGSKLGFEINNVSAQNLYAGYGGTLTIPQSAYEVNGAWSTDLEMFQPPANAGLNGAGAILKVDACKSSPIGCTSFAYSPFEIYLGPVANDTIIDDTATQQIVFGAGSVGIGGGGNGPTVSPFVMSMMTPTFGVMGFSQDQGATRTPDATVEANGYMFWSPTPPPTGQTFYSLQSNGYGYIAMRYGNTFNGNIYGGAIQAGEFDFFLPGTTTAVVNASITTSSTASELDFNGTTGTKNANLYAGNLTLSGLTAGTSPVCPNGPGGQLTTTGCSGGGGGGGLPSGTGIVGVTSGVGDLATSTDIVNVLNTVAPIGVLNSALIPSLPYLSLSGGTLTGPLTVSASGNGIAMTEAAAPSGASGQDVIWADSTAHQLAMNNNNGGTLYVVGATGTAIANHCAKFGSTGTTVVDAGAACGSGGGGLPTAMAPGQIYTSTAAGTTAAVQPQVFYSQSGDTIASIESECSSACTYYVTMPQTITLTASHALSWNVDLVFLKGGQWTVNGSGFTLTLQGRVNGTLSQHFAGTATLSFGGQQLETPVEWFGAVGYTTQAAAISGTDSTAAIQTCFNSVTVGQCLLQGFYYRTTAALTIAKSSVGLRGVKAGRGLPSEIIDTSTTANDQILYVGTSSTSPVYAWNSFNNFTLARATVPTGTTDCGLCIDSVGGYTVDNVDSQDSHRDFYYHDAPSYGVGVTSNSNAGFTLSGETSGTWDGYYLDSADGTPEDSIRFLEIAASNNTSSFTQTTRGMVVSGKAINDVMSDHLETANMTDGLVVNYTGGGGTIASSDLHFVNSILDGNRNSCAIITGTTSASDGSVELSGWCNGWNTSGKLIDIESSYGVKIHNMDITQHDNFGAVNGIYAYSSDGLVISNNNIHGIGTSSGAVNPIALSGTTHTTITGNKVTTLSGTAGNLIAFYSGSSYNTITGNTLAGYSSAGHGIYFDATSNYNIGAAANSIDATNMPNGAIGAAAGATGNGFQGAVTATGAVTALTANSTNLSYNQGSNFGEVDTFGANTTTIPDFYIMGRNSNETTNDQYLHCTHNSGNPNCTLPATITTSVGGTGTPTLAAGSAAGTGATISYNGTYPGDSVEGVIALTTGTSPGTGTLFTVTFPNTRAKAPVCMVQLASATGGQINTFVQSATTTVLTVSATSALTASTGYAALYICGGN